MKIQILNKHNKNSAQATTVANHHTEHIYNDVQNTNVRKTLPELI